MDRKIATLVISAICFSSVLCIAISGYSINVLAPVPGSRYEFDSSVLSAAASLFPNQIYILLQNDGHFVALAASVVLSSIWIFTLFSVVSFIRLKSSVVLFFIMFGLQIALSLLSNILLVITA
jgi:hypothetical protein